MMSVESDLILVKENVKHTNGGESIDSIRISLQESEWILATLQEIIPLHTLAVDMLNFSLTTVIATECFVHSV